MMQNPLHTPEEMRQISDLAHIAEGIVLGLAAFIAVLQAQGVFVQGRQRLSWPVLIVTAGVFLLAYLTIPHHGLAHARTQWRFVFGDPQQRQHVVISLLVLVGGSCQLLALAGKVEGRVWQLAWPATLVIVGLLFVIHQQHGTSDAIARAMFLHRVLGTTLAIAGAIAGANVLRSVPSRTLATVWPIGLLLASIMLLVYREPEGAYHGSQPEHGMSHDSLRQP